MALFSTLSRLPSWGGAAASLPPTYFNPNVGAPDPNAVDWVALGNLANAGVFDQPAPDYGPGPDYGAYDPGPQIIYDVAPAPPPYDPAKDPNYQALLAQLGLQETSYRTLAEQQIGRARADAAVQLPRIGEQGVQARKNINTGYEGRGMFRSGARLTDLALERRGEAERTADLERSLANRVAGINETLQGQLNDLAMKRATTVLQGSMSAAGL